MINRWERDLILRFGYPFDDIERQLKESADADVARVTDDPYWWEQVIVNLGISEREKSEIESSEELAHGVRALIERIADHLGLL
jgi:hypothetical protein